MTRINNYQFSSVRLDTKNNGQKIENKKVLWSVNRTNIGAEEKKKIDRN